MELQICRSGGFFLGGALFFQKKKVVHLFFGGAIFLEVQICLCELRNLLRPARLLQFGAPGVWRSKLRKLRVATDGSTGAEHASERHLLLVLDLRERHWRRQLWNVGRFENWLRRRQSSQGATRVVKGVATWQLRRCPKMQNKVTYLQTLCSQLLIRRSSPPYFFLSLWEGC